MISKLSVNHWNEQAGRPFGQEKGNYSGSGSVQNDCPHQGWVQATFGKSSRL